MAEEKINSIRLNVRGMRCLRSSLLVLDGISLNVGRGETLAIIGRSGIGKSTLLKCLSVLESSERGDAYLDGTQYLSEGRPIRPPWQIRREIVMVFQDYNLFPDMTCMRNITLALEKTGNMSKVQAEAVARQMASKLGIEETLGRYPESLSGGQAQRLALARAMVLEPKVLLLDEITSGLDPETIVNVVKAIRELRATDATGELAIILVTHLMHFAAEFADRIAFLHNGSIHEELPAKSFFLQCRKPETRQFVSAFDESWFKKDLG